MRTPVAIGVGAACLLVAASTAAGEDFAAYVRSSPDFRPVRQDRTLLLGRWDHWVCMPWRFQWGRGYDATLATAMREAGFNGGFCDHEPGPDADLHEANGFLWYLDHAAGKGDLHLRDVSPAQRSADRRPVCLADPTVRARLREKLIAAVGAAARYRTRAAYALDDEISWSSFTSPCRWDNDPRTLDDFRRWLVQRYGSLDAARAQWGGQARLVERRMATPDDFADLYARPWDEWNLSALCDAWSYMDSQLLNLVGDLVEEANRVDPDTPCGFVGAQCPAPYGGFDYAKIARKVQFLEAYDIGATAEILRSFNPDNLVPLVQANFLDPRTRQSDWFGWYYLAHGNRGVIAWADRWFTPDRNMLSAGDSIRRLEAASRLIVGGRWAHDGVAIYYSHPSIQVSWFIDAEAHGRTWINRSSSLNNQHASTVAAYWAWCKLLEDARLQYNFVSYADVLTRGLDPAEYPVLVLPRVLALSDAEADVIRAYVRAGGHVIADHLPGRFDQHGRGRATPALGDLFGGADVRPVGPHSLFGGARLTETDADTYWQQTFLEAAADVWPRCERINGFVIAQRDAPTFATHRFGAGSATLLNVSIMEYLVHRAAEPARARTLRNPVVERLLATGVRPRVELAAGGAAVPLAEAVYWRHDDRLSVWVVWNPLRLGSESGAGRMDAVPTDVQSLTLRFAQPQTGVRDERVGRDLGDGMEFTVPWRPSEAAIVSVRLPARRAGR